MPNQLNNQSTPVAPIEVAKRGQSSEIISRFLKNKTAVLGLGIALILVFAALFPTSCRLTTPSSKALGDLFATGWGPPLWHR